MSFLVVIFSPLLRICFNSLEHFAYFRSSFFFLHHVFTSLQHFLFFTSLDHFFISLHLFLYQGFLSQTVTIHMTAEEGRGPSFTPIYHFSPLMYIQTFTCNFACEIATTCFLFSSSVTTRLLLDEIYHLIE